MEINSLAHYGILGMRWGVRRPPPGKSVSELSDDEIQCRINRINLGQRYNDLTTTEVQKKLTRGKEFCEDLLKDIGGNVVKNLGRQVLDYYEKQS